MCSCCRECARRELAIIACTVTKIVLGVKSKGSFAVDGISLTVAEVDGELVSFTIIPHAYGHTTLHARRTGSRVDIEVDILAKHLEKLVGRS